LRSLSLAFDLHEPVKAQQPERKLGDPIIFIHGLFGSKKNNRSISKSVSVPPSTDKG